MFGISPHGGDSFFIACLLAPKRSSTIGVTEFHTARFSGGKCSLGALADKTSFKFGHRGHLSEQEAAHRSNRDVRQIAKH